MQVTVVGGGFVGEATGKGLAQHGNNVIFVDPSTERIATLHAHGFEALKPADATHLATDVTMLCVPTPTIKGKFKSDILGVAVTEFAQRLRNQNNYQVLVVRSTVPPKTTREFVVPLVEKISGKKAGKHFGVVMQPEYLREVTAAQDFARPWFVLIGQLDERSGDLIEKLYEPFDAPISRVTLEEAEFQKYVHNVFNAVKIAFFNEMRVVAADEGWNATDVFEATAESCEGIWNPLYGLRDFGPFDGSCLPKDTTALVEWGHRNGHTMGVLSAAIAENLRHQEILGKNHAVRSNVLDAETHTPAATAKKTARKTPAKKAAAKKTARKAPAKETSASNNGVSKLNGTNGVSKLNGTNGVSKLNGTNGVSKSDDAMESIHVGS